MAEKFWVSKYALSAAGIQEVEGERTLGSYVTVKPHGFYALGRDIFADRQAALTDAENRRVVKIASLEKQIAKLRKLKFS